MPIKYFGEFSRMLDDARPPVDVKQRCNPTALNLFSDHPFCNAVMGGGQNTLSTLFFLSLNIYVSCTHLSSKDLKGRL